MRGLRGASSSLEPQAAVRDREGASSRRGVSPAAAGTTGLTMPSRGQGRDSGEQVAGDAWCEPAWQVEREA